MKGFTFKIVLFDNNSIVLGAVQKLYHAILSLLRPLSPLSHTILTFLLAPPPFSCVIIIVVTKLALFSGADPKISERGGRGPES